MNERSLKWIVLFETFLLILLLIKIVVDYKKDQIISRPNDGLLSKRIYAGLLEPKSYLVTNFYPLEKALRSYIKDNNFTVSIYVENLNNGANFAIAERNGAFPGSINKIPLAVLILQKVESKQLDLNQRINNQPHAPTIKELLEKMLKDSDNDAFQSLGELINKAELKKLMDYYSIDTYGAYNPNSTQIKDLLGPRDFSNIFSSLYFSTVLEPEHSEYILKLLTNTTFNLKERADLPDDVKLAHKYGEYYINNKLFHDCGIIYSATLRISYCVMTQGLEENDAINVIAATVNTIYTYSSELRAKLDNYKKNGLLTNT